jgi:hypothetical protein
VPCRSETNREAVLAHFISNHWQTAGSSEDWDLHKNGTRVLIAMEKLDYKHMNLLVRIWGAPWIVRETLESLTTTH